MPDNKIPKSSEDLITLPQIISYNKSIEVYLKNDYATRGLKERRKQEEERNLLKEEIKSSTKKISELYLEKSTVELDQQKIEAEVGPLKYIAELIYGENAKDHFDEAVRYAIMVLIFVFDPVAVLMLIAANISIGEQRMKKKPEILEGNAEEEIAKILKKKSPCSTIEARSLRLNSSSIPISHPLVEAGVELGRTTYGSPTLSDQAVLSCPSLKLGPGYSPRSHTADEFIYLAEIEEGIDIYIKLLEKIL